MKIQKRFVVSAVFILMALSISLSVYAQEAPRQPQENTFYFVSSEMSFDGKVVKGAPYSAQAISETTQTLGDGNHIKRTNSATVCLVYVRLFATTHSTSGKTDCHRNLADVLGRDVAEPAQYDHDLGRRSTRRRRLYLLAL